MSLPHDGRLPLAGIGDLLLGSSWKEALVEAGVVQLGTADGILILHVTKAKYAHQVSYVALLEILKEEAKGNPFTLKRERTAEY